jgi:hypothetical protein
MNTKHYALDEITFINFQPNNIYLNNCIAIEESKNHEWRPCLATKEKLFKTIPSKWWNYENCTKYYVRILFCKSITYRISANHIFNNSSKWRKVCAVFIASGKPDVSRRTCFQLCGLRLVDLLNKKPRLFNEKCIFSRID